MTTSDPTSGTPVTGLGMTSSVGLGVVRAAAAIRAGLSLPSELELTVMGGDEDEGVPARGHPIRGLTDGYQRLGRWLRLAARAFADLVDNGGLPNRADPASFRRTMLALATPVLDRDRFAIDEPWSESDLADRYAHDVLRVCELPLSRADVEVFALGHAATAAAVAAGIEAIRQGKRDRVIVLAADSYLDGASLEWIASHDRLREPERAVGMFPGEAGACLVLESPTAAGARGASVIGMVEAAQIGREPNNYFSENPSNGGALADVALRSLAGERSFTGDLYADLNGEEWRAREVAGARSRLGPAFAPSRIVMPAMSLGDTGAASGAVAACVALRRFVRDSEAAARALLLASGEHGHVGALRLSNIHGNEK